MGKLLTLVSLWGPTPFFQSPQTSSTGSPTPVRLQPGRRAMSLLPSRMTAWGSRVPAPCPPLSSAGRRLRGTLASRCTQPHLSLPGNQRHPAPYPVSCAAEAPGPARQSQGLLKRGKRMYSILLMDELQDYEALPHLENAIQAPLFQHYNKLANSDFSKGMQPLDFREIWLMVYKR